MTIWPHLQKGFPNGAQPSSQSSQSGVIGDTEFWILLYWLLVRCSGRVTGKCLHQLAKMVYQGTLQDDLLARSATILIVYILHTVYRVTLMTLKQCTHKSQTCLLCSSENWIALCCVAFLAGSQILWVQKRSTFMPGDLFWQAIDEWLTMLVFNFDSEKKRN